MLRRALLALGWAIVVGLGALEVLCALRVRLPVPLDWLWAFVPELFLPAWLVLIAALVGGARLLLVGAVVVAAGHVALLAPAMTGSSSTAPDDATALRVVTANVLFTNEDVRSLMAEVVAVDADVVVLQEVTPTNLVVIDEAFASYAHRAVLPLSTAHGAALYSRAPLRDVEVTEVAGVQLQAATLAIGGRDVRLWNVHTVAPKALGRHIVRDDQLALLDDLRAEVTLPLVAAGDFNATVWHPRMRDLLDHDLDDAAGRVGRGLVTTWKGAPVLESGIDHVLVSGDVGVAGVDVGEGSGSDHRPVVADLWLRR